MDRITLLDYGSVSILVASFVFLCPQRNFGRHIVITLSDGVRLSDPWMHLGMAKCHVPFSGHCDLDLDP